jgi:hypothetical protein
MKIENVFSSRQMYRHITRKKNPIKFNYMYVLHDHPLESLEEAKYLNITIRQDSKWKGYVINVCTKVNKTLGLLIRNLNISLASVKEKVYTCISI